MIFCMDKKCYRDSCVTSFKLGFKYRYSKTICFFHYNEKELFMFIYIYIFMFMFIYIYSSGKLICESIKKKA